jgi:gliding motility-associated-like protein
LVKVNNLSTFNPLPDTTRLCGVSARLDAGVTFSKYSWSTGETQQIIEPQIGGKYFVTVTDNLNCTASDSTYLSLVNANISQNDTTICNGGSITLSVDTVFKVINTFGTSLPTNLRSDLVAYYPFNGNANDESGNNNHATVYNARLTTDRFGRPNSAYAFSPTDRSSIIPGILNTSMVNSFTYSVWVKPLNSITIPPQGQAANAASGFPNNTCVIHPIHGQNYGPPTLNTGTGVYVGTNGVYLEEHSAGWEAVPISHQMNLTGWHLINIVYENKIPTLYIDGVFIKKGIPSSRQIYASLGPDRYPFLGPTASPSYNRSGIGAGYIPATGTTQYFNGDIDDIFFYRRALSSNEVTQIYNGALNVRWSTGDTTSRITVTPSATTKYFVTVSDGITTCIDSILVKVNNLSSFNPFPDTLSQCGKNINLDAGANFQTYKWSTGSTIRNITVTQGGKYTVDAVTADGCKASDSTIVSLVDVNIDNRDTTICSLSSLNIGLSSSFTHKYRWSTGDITPSIVVNPTETTTYYVNATDDITTCTDSIKVSVELPAKGIRYPTQDIIVNRPTELTARNFGKAYLWTPDLQLNSPRLLNPIITPSKQQQYTVKITTDAGCITIDTVLIRVFPDRNIYVPEGFTPDADGRNDRLYPIPVGIREMRTFRIYNRWGTLLFDNKNANINTGWDGTYLGNAQPMESYVWIAEGIDVDGKFIRRSGNTILIR